MFLQKLPGVLLGISIWIFPRIIPEIPLGIFLVFRFRILLRFSPQCSLMIPRIQPRIPSLIPAGLSSLIILDFLYFKYSSRDLFGNSFRDFSLMRSKNFPMILSLIFSDFPKGLLPRFLQKFLTIFFLGIHPRFLMISPGVLSGWVSSGIPSGAPSGIPPGFFQRLLQRFTEIFLQDVSRGFPRVSSEILPEISQGNSYFLRDSFRYMFLLDFLL